MGTNKVPCMPVLQCTSTNIRPGSLNLNIFDLHMKYICQESGDGNEMGQIKEWSCDNGEIGDDWSKFEIEMTWFMIGSLTVKEPFDWVEKPLVNKNGYK